MIRTDETDIVGTKLGKITILSYSKRFKGNIFYNCQCDCGAIWEVARSSLIGEGYKKTRQCLRCRTLECRAARRKQDKLDYAYNYKWRSYRSHSTIDGKADYVPLNELKEEYE